MMTNYIKKDKNLIIKLICFSLIFTAFFISIRGFNFNSAKIADSLAVIGLVYLIIGLFRYVNKLGLFNFSKFGFLKFWEMISTDSYTEKKSYLKTYNDYLKNLSYNKKYVPYLLVGLINIVISFLLI